MTGSVEVCVKMEKNCIGAFATSLLTLLMAQMRTGEQWVSITVVLGDIPVIR